MQQNTISAVRFLVCWFLLGFLSVFAEDVSVATNVIAVRPLSPQQSEGSVVAYFEKGSRLVFNLALSDVSDSPIVQTSRVLFSRPWSRNWDECDILITPSQKTLCLLLGEKSRGYGHIYELLFLRYEPKKLTAELYPHHLSKRADDRTSDDVHEQETRPLPINTILRAHLESDLGRNRQIGHRIAVPNMAGVRFEHGSNQDCEVVGTINESWRFSLKILLDEEKGGFEVGVPTLSELKK